LREGNFHLANFPLWPDSWDSMRDLMIAPFDRKPGRTVGGRHEDLTEKARPCLVGNADSKRGSRALLRGQPSSNDRQTHPGVGLVRQPRAD